MKLDQEEVIACSMQFRKVCEELNSNHDLPTIMAGMATAVSAIAILQEKPQSAFDGYLALLISSFDKLMANRDFIINGGPMQ